MWEPGVIFDWACIVFEIFALSYLVLKNSDLSSRLSLGVWLFSNVLMQLISAQVYLWCETYPENSYTIWYGSWIGFNLVSLWLVLMLHQITKTSTSSFTKFVSASFLALTCVQIVGYLDRAIFETRALSEFYRFMIIAINFAIVPAVAAEMWKYKLKQGAV